MSEDRRNVLRTDVVDINVHLSWQAELPEWVVKSQPACSISVCTEDFARAAKSCGIIHKAKIYCKIVELWSLNLTVFLNTIPDYHRVFQCPPGSFLALFLELSCQESATVVLSVNTNSMPATFLRELHSTMEQHAAFE